MKNSVLGLAESAIFTLVRILYHMREFIMVCAFILFWCSCDSKHTQHLLLFVSMWLCFRMSLSKLYAEVRKLNTKNEKRLTRVNENGNPYIREEDMPEAILKLYELEEREHG